MNYRVGLVALAILASMSSAYAWNSEGHMIVAEIAWSHLNQPKRDRAIQLLKLNPDYQNWIAGVPDVQKDEFAFLRAATWPDAIKERGEGHIFDGEEPSGPSSGQNIGYSDKNQHRYWHFVDTPFSRDGTPLIQPVTPNAQSQIQLFEATLDSISASDDVKSYDLVWLEHLVGDVHQPLHATSQFSSAFPSGDEGGNRVSICITNCHQNLHAFWDDILGTSIDPADAIAAAGRLAPPQSSDAAVSDVGTWISNSFNDAQNIAYGAPIGIGPGPFPIDDRYTAAARAEAEKQIALAGLRLSNLLNAKLK
jgi:hypothetical protein